MNYAFHIGSRVFPSKAAARKAIQAVLYSLPTGSSIGNRDDFIFLYDILAMHPEAHRKIGCGVLSFQIEQNGGSRGFWLTRVDGTRTDWSFLSCLNPPTPGDDARKAFRSAIRHQIDAFRGLRATPEQAGWHVDHSPPFEDLLQGFLIIRGLELLQIRVLPPCDGDTETRLADLEVQQAWQDFHAQYARLRLIPVKENLSKGRR